MSSWSWRSDPSSPARRALSALVERRWPRASRLARLPASRRASPRPISEVRSSASWSSTARASASMRCLEVGRLHELLDAAGALVEGQLQRLEPPADLLRPHGLLQVTEPVGHRRLQGVEAADDVVAPQRLLHAGQPVGHRPLQRLEPGAPAPGRGPRAAGLAGEPSVSVRSIRPSRSVHLVEPDGLLEVPEPALAPWPPAPPAGRRCRRRRATARRGCSRSAMAPSRLSSSARTTRSTPASRVPRVSSSSSMRPSSWPSVPSWRESSPSRSVTSRSSASSFRSTSANVSRWARCSASWATTARLKSSSTRGTSGTSGFSGLVIGPKCKRRRGSSQGGKPDRPRDTAPSTPGGRCAIVRRWGRSWPSPAVSGQPASFGGWCGRCRPRTSWSWATPATTRSSTASTSRPTSTPSPTRWPGPSAPTGWGLADDTFRTLEAYARYGEPTWFRLGDADLATHLYRTSRLRDGGDPDRGDGRDHPGLGREGQAPAHDRRPGGDRDRRRRRRRRRRR